MDVDQLLKRIQWAEEERRKDKDVLTMLDNRIVAVEGGSKAVVEQIKQVSSEVARLTAVLTRMDQYDGVLLQQRLEARRALEEVEKDVKKRDEEAEKVRRVEMRALESSIADVRRQLDVLPRLEKGIQMRVDEDVRLRRSIDEVAQRVELLRRDEEEYTRTYRLLEDGRRQDAKRITDLQGELAALRKQGDSQRGQIEILNTAQRKLDTRLNELAVVEADRREEVGEFIDKQALAQVERERVWREWQARFETVEKQATEIERQLITLDATHRDTKRAQVVLDELNQKVERRLSEVAEVQRLADDRFRQEWVTFKADDQKRWTNYTLTQEEQRGEARRQYERMTEQIVELAERQQEVQDLLQQFNELAEKRLQGLLALAHEWVSTYERAIGRT